MGGEWGNNTQGLTAREFAADACHGICGHFKALVQANVVGVSTLLQTDERGRWATEENDGRSMTPELGRAREGKKENTGRHTTERATDERETGRATE